jgi:2-polyprenyl-6-methoxyphenol hydroxylase-like FAD-dependent oxidoreductase
MRAKILSHAIVLGGSAAGLFAARVLADNADHVALVDRDPLPNAVLHRKGTPQSRHANNLLPRAVEMLETWFPGVTAELIQAGAVPVADEARAVIRGVRHARTRGAPTALLLTRPLLDAVLRGRVRALDNVTFHTERDVTGFCTDDDSNVNGVRLRDAENETTLMGDLVVDAMGRGSRGRRWMTELGYGEPMATELTVNVHYATRLFSRGARDAGGDKLMLISPTIDNPRGAVAFAVEDERWLVTLFAYGGMKPPSEVDEFRAFAHSLVVSDIGDLVTRATPLDDGVVFAYPTTALRRFDRLPAIPGGYLCLGDSVCQLNPSYGQGITSAALQAQALARALTGGSESLPRRYYKLAVEAAAHPFDLSWSADLDLPTVVGPPSPTPRPVAAYLKRAMRVAGHDAVVATAIRRIIGLVDPPPALLKPPIAVRVLFGRNGAVAEIAPQVTVPRETPSAQRPSRSPELPAEPLL